MIKELKPGDVLIFKAGDDFVGRSIAWITKSDVSHAAMVFGNDTIIEMGAKGIQLSHIHLKDGSGGAYQLRLNPAKAPESLILAAQKYLDRETPYDFPALVLLAGLLIYRQIRPTPKMKIVTDMILRAACKILDALIDDIIHKKSARAMVCSQLVYQCYRDCGGEYEIKIHNGDLQASNGTARLIDLIGTAQDECLSEAEIPAVEHTDDELAKMLLAALEESAKEDADLSFADDNTLVSRARQFLERIEKLLEEADIDIPIDALFITPGDLLYHAENLEKIDFLEVERD